VIQFGDIEKLNDIVCDLAGKYTLPIEQKQKYFDELSNFIDYHKQQKDEIGKETGERPEDLYDASVIGPRHLMRYLEC